MHKLIISALVSSLFGTPALAQGAQSQSAQTPAISPVAQNQAAARHDGDRQQNEKQGAQLIERGLRTWLVDAGYTEIEMAPIYFAVRAKDADGNPVLLMLSPDSVSEWQLRSQSSADDAPTNIPGQQRF